MNTKTATLALVAVLAISTHPARADEVTCESQGGKRTECDMDTRGEVRLVRQLSKAACTEGVNWGYSKHTIWVEGGCRGVFASGNDAAAPPASHGGGKGLPLINATCGDGIDVHVDEHGPVYVDGRETSLKKVNDNYYEATDGETGTVISISMNPDGTPSLSYTGRHGANGICNTR